MDSRDQIIFLALCGTEISEICAHTGANRGSVDRILGHARARFMKEKEAGFKAPSLSKWRDEFNAAAARRNLSAQELARRILETVAAEDLFDAVLDDSAAHTLTEHEGNIT